MEYSATVSGLPLNKLLRMMVSPSTDSVARDSASRAISATLPNPLEIVDSETIPEQHEYKTEARIVLDAFETCANGVNDPECVEKLDSVADSGFFGPWKGAIKALFAFYERDNEMVLKMAPLVSPESAPFAIILEIDALSRDRDTGSSHGALSRLVFPHDGSLEELVEEFEESCRECAETAFLRCSSRLVKEILPRSRKAAIKAGSAALTRADSLDLVPDELFQVLARTLGESDAARIAARYFQESRPDLSFMFWVKSAIAALSVGSLDALNCSVRLLACALAAEAASGDATGNDPEIVKSAIVSCRELEETVRLTFGLSRVSRDGCEDDLFSCASSLGASALLLSSLAGARTPTKGKRKGKTGSNPSGKEYDLFCGDENHGGIGKGKPRFRDLLESGPEKMLLKELSDIDPPFAVRDLLEGLPRKARYIGPEPWLALIREHVAARRSLAVKG